MSDVEERLERNNHRQRQRSRWTQLAGLATDAEGEDRLAMWVDHPAGRVAHELS